jgi:hypothetical protein
VSKLNAMFSSVDLEVFSNSNFEVGIDSTKDFDEYASDSSESGFVYPPAITILSKSTIEDERYLLTAEKY